MKAFKLSWNSKSSKGFRSLEKAKSLALMGRTGHLLLGWTVNELNKILLEWIMLEKTTYRDPTGHTRTCETEKHTTRGQLGDGDGSYPRASKNPLLGTHHSSEAVPPPVGGYRQEFPQVWWMAAKAQKKLLRKLALRVTLHVLQPYVWIWVCQISCTMYISTITLSGDDNGNVRPEPQSGDGGFVEVISLLKNDPLKRRDALVAEGYLRVDARAYFCVQVTKTCTREAFEGLFLKLEWRRTVATFLHTEPPGLLH